MLAQTFKTAKELKISQAKYDALVKVYWMFADEKIPEHLFDMGTIGSPVLLEKGRKEVPCGSPGCILGWCQAVSFEAFMPGSATDYVGTGLHSLFFSPVACCDYATSRAQAAKAIHNFLTTGSANWREVLKG